MTDRVEEQGERYEVPGGVVLVPESRALHAEQEAERLKLGLRKLDAIRNSIIGCQNVNWSAHIYPMVAALHEAGFEGLPYEEARAKFAPAWEQSQPETGGPVPTIPPHKAIENELERISQDAALAHDPEERRSD